MRVQLLVPERAEVEVPLLAAELASRPPLLAPFSDDAVDFAARLSRALFQDAEAKRHPELLALAHRLRKAELLRLAKDFAALETPETILVPRGLVLHLPPANVDTIFVYSWLFAFLTGNRSVIRLPRRLGAQIEAVMRVFGGLLEGAPEPIRANTTMLTYGHEREITAALSAAADVRVIWGGDATVSEIRSIPLPPHARELTFPDRYSLGAIRTAAYLALGEAERQHLAEAFFNDSYWFDQLGCSSPRLLVWCGEPGDSRAAGAIFFEHLRGVVARRGYRLDAGNALGKLTFAFRAILDQPVTGYELHGGAVTVLPLASLDGLDRAHCGGGLFYQFQAPDLAAVAAFVARKDQTLAYFGFEAEEMIQLARRLNGRGLDRIVPFGEALSFHRFWDGYDLLAEFTRRVHVSSPPRPA